MKHIATGLIVGASVGVAIMLVVVLWEFLQEESPARGLFLIALAVSIVVAIIDWITEKKEK